MSRARHDPITRACHWCEEHGKHAYPSRKVASRMAKRLYPGAHLSEYQCTVHEGKWHLGRLPKKAIEGDPGTWRRREGIQDGR